MLPLILTIIPVTSRFEVMMIHPDDHQAVFKRIWWDVIDQNWLDRKNTYPARSPVQAAWQVCFTKTWQKDACPAITDPTCGVSSSDFQPEMFTKQLIWDDVHKLFCHFPPKQDLACFRLHQTPLESKKLSTLITPWSPIYVGQQNLRTTKQTPGVNV